MDLGIPVQDYQVFSWRIPNYRKLTKRVTSETFTVGGHEWCVVISVAKRLREYKAHILARTHRNILLFPQGNSNGQANDMVSIYLNYGDPKKQPEGWHVCAQFALAISNPNDPACYIQSRTSLPLVLTPFA